VKVYLRGRLYWYRLRVTLKTADGTKQKYERYYPARTERRQEATEKAYEHLKAIRDGKVHPDSPWPPAAPAPGRQRPTLKDFRERFLDYIRGIRKPSTAVFYETCLNRTLTFHPLSEVPMSEVTSELIAKYVKFRLSLRSHSVAALNGEMRTLRRCFGLAEEWGEVNKVPTIHEVPGSINRDRVITFEEERDYLEAASGTLRDLATLAVDTGMRGPSELFCVQWSNVYLEEVSTEFPFGRIYVPDGRTPAARRNIPLTSRCKAILERRRSAKVTSFYVFPGEGRTGHITTAQQPHERAIRKARIKPFEFYCWRHTCGTRWAEAGLDPYSIASLMGHSSPRLAERYYIHVTQPHVSRNFERFIKYQDQRLKSLPEPIQRKVVPLRSF
jgi:integrase